MLAAVGDNAGVPGRPFDAAVVGAGIVGLAIARELQRRGRRRVVVLEKEARVASHQTGRNSGVMHSGIYYAPGSLRARLCRRGGQLLRDFCDRNGVAYRLSGKLVVAREAGRETEALESLLERGTANGVPDLKILDRSGLRAVEPCADGAAALHVPSAGVVRFDEVAEALAESVREAGGEVRTGFRVARIDAERTGVRLDGGIRAGMLVTAAGLHADRVARLAGEDPEILVAPFRGEYFRLRRPELVRGLIYPVPDPRFPFLGVHVHRNLDGEVHAGPNAVLALAREGYRRRDARAADLFEMAAFVGMRRFLRREWRAGVVEVRRSFSRRRFAASLARLVPAIRPEDLEPAPPGVRAIAMLPDGRIADDFRIRRSENRIHLLNAPSPAATAALAVAERVGELADG